MFVPLFIYYLRICIILIHIQYTVTYFIWPQIPLQACIVRGWGLTQHALKSGESKQNLSNTHAHNKPLDWELSPSPLCHKATVQTTEPHRDTSGHFLVLLISFSSSMSRAHCGLLNIIIKMHSSLKYRKSYITSIHRRCCFSALLVFRNQIKLMLELTIETSI